MKILSILVLAVVACGKGSTEGSTVGSSGSASDGAIDGAPSVAMGADAAGAITPHRPLRHVPIATDVVSPPDVPPVACSGNTQCVNATPTCGNPAVSTCTGGSCRFALNTGRTDCPCMVDQNGVGDTRNVASTTCPSGQQVCAISGTGTMWNCVPPAPPPPDAPPPPPDASAPVPTAVYCADSDGDGYCTNQCVDKPAPGQPGAPTSGWMLSGNCQHEKDDCDSNKDKHPGAPERCDGGDWNCDGDPNNGPACSCPASGQNRCAPGYDCVDTLSAVDHCGPSCTNCLLQNPPNLMGVHSCDNGRCVFTIKNIR